MSLLARTPLRTARLILTPLDATHVAPLAAMLADPVVMTYFPRTMTLPESEAWWRRTVERYERHGTGLLAVLHADTGVFLGDCGVQVRTFGGRTHLELGYHFTREAWGCGYATEAARACLETTFDDAGAAGVIALIRPENQPSQRVARRLRMRVESGVLHLGLVHDQWHISREAFAGLTLQ
ncbi:MAG TPA: GNAT family N-acetyltransferase [Luteitalea sp.]|nr:GNAT family N-acetyltransferase [Luteitalea sp.]